MTPACRTHDSASRRVTARGLTVVELMLVLAVVGVLASLAVSGWNGWRNKVRNQKAQADIIAISAAVDAYWNDNSSYPASLAAVGRGGMKDPWGRAYVYVPLNLPADTGKARKDHSLVPLNTDFDLYSKGADGATAGPLTAKASKDDILRANNGRYIGLGADY